MDREVSIPLRRLTVAVFVLVLTLALMLTVSVATSQAATNVLAKHVTAKAVEGSSPHNPVIVSSTFFTTDKSVYSWLNFVNVISGSHLIRWDWYDPSGILNTSSNATIQGPGDFVSWGYLPISGYVVANMTGTWQVKVFFDGISSATDTFRIIKPPWGVIASTEVGPTYSLGIAIAVDSIANRVYTMSGSDSGQFCVTVGVETHCQPGYYLRISNGTTLASLGSHITGITGHPAYTYCNLYLPSELGAIHLSPTGPVDVLILGGGVGLSPGGCVWDYHEPGNASSIIGNPTENFAVVAVSLSISWMDMNPTGYPLYFGGTNSQGGLITRLNADGSTTYISLGSMYGGGHFVVNTATNKIYAVGTNNNVLVINSNSSELSSIIPVQLGVMGGTLRTDIAVNPSTNRVYVTGRNSVIVIDGSTDSVIANINGFSPDSNMVIDTTNNLIYADEIAFGTMMVASGFTNSKIAEFKIGPCAIDGSHLGINRQTGSLYVAGGGAVAGGPGTSDWLCEISGQPAAPYGSSGQIVINEVALNPEPGLTSGVNSTQWVELFNSGPATVDISGWSLTPVCSGGITGCNDPPLSLTATIPDGTEIPAKGYYVYETPSQWQGSGGGSWLGTINETLVLRDSTGRIVDWTPPLTDPLTGYFASGYPANPDTWQRYPNGQDTHTAADWRLMPATKGSQNLITAPVPEFPLAPLPIMAILTLATVALEKRCFKSNRRQAT